MNDAFVEDFPLRLGFAIDLHTEQSWRANCYSLLALPAFAARYFVVYS